jgi:hypothetical protein
MHAKWEELSYELRTATKTRILTITPHFQKISKGWFDTGQYTVSEKGKPLGNIYMDLYTGGQTQWDGSKDEFTPQELRDIANHIAYMPVK